MKDILTALLGLPVPTRRSSTDTEWTDDGDDSAPDAGDAPHDAAPNDSGDAPNDGGDAPHDVGDAPNDGGDASNHDGGDAPNDGGDAPNDGGHAPGPNDGLDAPGGNDGEETSRSGPDLRRMVGCELPASQSVEILEEPGVAPMPVSCVPMSGDPANADTLVYEWIGGDTQEPASKF